MKTSHQDLTIPKDRFSRANEFYFSVYPEDYARTVDTVQAYESDAAYDVMKAIRNWAEGFGDRKERIEKWNKGWKAGLRLSEERSKSKEQLDTRRVAEKEAKGTTEETRQGSGKAGRTGSGGKKRKEIERHEEDRTVNQGRVSEKADELENYRDDIEVGDGIGEEQEESRPTVEAEETSERGNDKEGNGRSEVGLTGDGFRTDKDSEYEKRIDNNRAYQDVRTKQVREEEISETKSESSSSSSSNSISVVTGKGDSLRARAYCILERGAMPLCPQAKRDWNSVNQVDLELNNQHLLWPPTNLRALTPD